MSKTPSVPITGLVGGDSDALYATLPLMQSIFHRSEITEGEKLMWLWMVIHCALTQTTSCIFSYLELANMMRWKTDSVHRGLHRLQAMGFLSNELPFLHGVVTFADSLVRRTFNPTLPEHEDAIHKEIEINLVRNSLRAEANLKKSKELNELDLSHINGGCEEYPSDALFNDTPSCHGIPWTEMLRCILNMLKTDKVWSG